MRIKNVRIAFVLAIIAIAVAFFCMIQADNSTFAQSDENKNVYSYDSQDMVEPGRIPALGKGECDCYVCPYRVLYKRFHSVIYGSEYKEESTFAPYDRRARDNDFLYLDEKTCSCEDCPYLYFIIEWAEIEAINDKTLY